MLSQESIILLTLLLRAVVIVVFGLTALKYNLEMILLTPEIIVVKRAPT